MTLKEIIEESEERFRKEFLIDGSETEYLLFLKEEITLAVEKMAEEIMLKNYKGYMISIQLGWLLDIYVKNPELLKTNPKAKLEIQPMLPKKI
jgi:hypothetical protein